MPIFDDNLKLYRSEEPDSGLSVGGALSEAIDDAKERTSLMFYAKNNQPGDSFVIPIEFYIPKETQ